MGLPGFPGQSTNRASGGVTVGPYSKFVVAVFGAMLASAQTAIPMSPLWHGILTVLITGTTAFAVRQVENVPGPKPPAGS